MNWWAIGYFLAAWLLSVIATVGIDLVLLFTRIKTETVMAWGAGVAAIAGSLAFANNSYALALGFVSAFASLIALAIDAESYTMAHKRKIGKRTDVYYED